MYKTGMKREKSYSRHIATEQSASNVQPFLQRSLKKVFGRASREPRLVDLKTGDGHF
jgi:hypothetical protein